MGASFDLAVVGGGPAGATAALEGARLGLSVALFEPRTDDRDKPCGEGILPPGARTLDELGLAPLMSRARCFDRLRYRIAGHRPLEVELAHPGYALPRPELMAGLEAALARTNVTRFAERVQVKRADRGFVLTGAHQILARTLVAADGLGGHSAHWLRSEGFASERLGIRARFRARAEEGPLDAVEIHLGPGGDVYLTPLPDGEVNAAFLFERPPRGRTSGSDGGPASSRGSAALVHQALLEHPEAARRLGPETTRPAARRLDRVAPRQVAAQGAFLAGDAGGGVDPVLGCGLTVGLRSGVAAARAASAVVEGRPGAESAYVANYARETHARRRLAWGLRHATRFPALLRGALAVGRRAPRLLEPLMRVAVGQADP